MNDLKSAFAQNLRQGQEEQRQGKVPSGAAGAAEPEEGESENMDREKMDSVLNSIRMAYGIKRANVLRQLEGGAQ